MLSLQCCGLKVAVSRVIECMPKVGKQLGQPPACNTIITDKRSALMLAAVQAHSLASR